MLDADGTIDGALAERGPTGSSPTAASSPTCCTHGEADRPALRITQDDVRAIQLAKAALQAGVRLLMDHAGLESLTDVGSVRLAGAFGSHIDPLYALVLGLLPGLPARPCACRPATRPARARCGRCSPPRHGREIAQVARTVTKVETAIEPRFQEHFVASLAFPHATDPYPHLAQVLPLPARRPAGPAAPTGAAAAADEPAHDQEEHRT